MKYKLNELNNTIFEYINLFHEICLLSVLQFQFLSFSIFLIPRASCLFSRIEHNAIGSFGCSPQIHGEAHLCHCLNHQY